LHEALVSVREESLDLGRYVHAGQAAAVVVAKDLPDGVWDGRTRATIPDRSWGWSIGGEWRWHGQIPRGSAHVFVVGPRDVAVSEDAIETAIDFWRKRRINWLCLTILSDSTPSAAARTVADRWRSLIGGFVPSDPERRAAVATDMERRFPETRPHLDYWRAIAEGG
jgi:hypothetical protein